MTPRRALVAAYSLAAAGTLIWLLGVPIVRGLLTSDDESFSMTVADLTTSAEEDLEIIVALREFFQNSTAALGYDGWTAWSIDA